MMLLCLALSRTLALLLSGGHFALNPLLCLDTSKSPMDTRTNQPQCLRLCGSLQSELPLVQRRGNALLRLAGMVTP